ncbi:Cut9-interacting protein scn1 [Coemansia sp. RSA 1722]|nr:Cut9-interacting protein scn1 [Coemansia sp. RSA 486]KAJ2237748.1 Cut9-interacting protein scn1 [Coemansia sp. RSA 485]KAJ2602498.1 Cut9-interacting protein scn1 [Coemansia sp. RSA 1721]KAJ2606020.1 Cut9-interacting protein scn1 [Coemansia sp. RSA 1722]KAJ2639590.1 Cut9-interacting protein scn1 [Coemansia sp. RSA 1286]
MVVYDVHCHIHETPAAYGTLEEHPDVVYCVQATNHADWQAVAELKTRYPDRIVPAFGIHPWFVERLETGVIPDTWEAELQQLVTQHGGIVGECGLDKIARNPETGNLYPFEPQIQLLKRQLQISTDLNVPVSLHCVRAFGAMVDVLREAEKQGWLPPRIMLHSYSGSADMLKQIFLKGELGKRVYVSFSQFVNGRNADKSTQCMQVVPENRILVESDLHKATDSIAALDDIVGFVCRARGWSSDDARERLAANSRHFFGL